MPSRPFLDRDIKYVEQVARLGLSHEISPFSFENMKRYVSPPYYDLFMI